MSFFDNMRYCISENIPCEPSFRVVLFGECAGYFENIKTIKSFSPEQIILVVKNGGLAVSGANMFIKKFCAGDLVICGKIKSVEKL